MSAQRYSRENISIFWDYDSTRWTSAMSAASNYNIVKNIREAITMFGAIKGIRAYADFSAEALPRSITIRSELSSSGVTLIDCPGDGRRDLSAKIMIVDILIQAWDHPPPYTFVLITGDRDLAYAVSNLRTRGYRVIVVSPSTTHVDITAQATFHLDWTRVILGLGGGSDLDEDTLPGQFSSASRNASSSQQRHKPEGNLGNSYNFGKDMTSGPSLRTEEQVSNPLMYESRKTTNRGNPVFSTYHDPQRFDIFGNINSDISMPETTRNVFGFGDGPLFPRPASQATKMRADSAPPNIRHSSVQNSPHISRSSQSTTENSIKDDTMPSSMKGKGREAETTKVESMSIIPEVSGGAVPPHFSYSGFGPFETFPAPFAGVSVSPPTVELRSQEPDSSSSSSNSISTVSKFSMIHHDHADMSTAPTSAIPPVAVEKSDSTIEAATVLPDSSNETTTATSSISQAKTGSSGKANGGNTKAGAIVIDPATAQLPPLRKMSDPPKNVPKKESSVQTPNKSQSPAPPPPPPPRTPALAGPPAVAASKQTMRPRSSSTITVPAEFSTLVSVLREQQPKFPSVTKTVLGGLLIKKDSNVYRKANCSKFSTYIAAAAKAGIINESVNSVGDQCISLQTPYALQ